MFASFPRAFLWALSLLLWKQSKTQLLISHSDLFNDLERSKIVLDLWKLLSSSRIDFSFPAWGAKSEKCAMHEFRSRARREILSDLIALVRRTNHLGFESQWHEIKCRIVESAFEPISRQFREILIVPRKCMVELFNKSLVRSNLLTYSMSARWLCFWSINSKNIIHCPNEVLTIEQFKEYEYFPIARVIKCFNLAKWTRHVATTK